MGSMGEDGGGVRTANAKESDFTKLFSAEYLFSDYVKQNRSVLPRMATLYGPGGADGPPPPGACNTTSSWFWCEQNGCVFCKF